MLPHKDCPEQMLRSARRSGMDVQVHTVRPESTSSYPPQEYICPHGVPHWIVPTPEQRSRWEGHESCADVLKERLLRNQNLKVDVVEARKPPNSAFVPFDYTCPHGRTLWYWPSRETLEAMADEILRRARPRDGEDS